MILKAVWFRTLLSFNFRNNKIFAVPHFLILVYLNYCYITHTFIIFTKKPRFFFVCGISHCPFYIAGKIKNPYSFQKKVNKERN
jgi:hypothetical protein